MKKISEKTLFSGQWLTLKEDEYVAKDGQKSHWERVERKNSKTTLGIIAKLVPSNRYVLIKQYRPAVENYVIGFPAGILEDQIIEKEALRELKEETGYIGKVVDVSPALKTNFGVINENNHLVIAEIDERLPENKNPEQELEHGEEIEVIIKAKEEIRDYLLAEKKAGTQISSGVWLAFAIEK